MDESQQQAWACFQQGRLDEALRLADGLLARHPADARLLLLKGLACARLDRLPEAEASLLASLRGAQTYEALLSLGQLYLVTGDADKARQYLEAAVDHRPDAAEARITLANFLANQGDYEPALAIYRQLADDGQADAGVLGNAALTLESLRRPDEAARFANLALQQDPGHAVASLVLARQDRVAGRYAEAGARLEQALGRQPAPVDAASLHTELGMVLDRSRDYDRAFTSFRHANDTWKQLAGAHLQLKQVYLDRISRLSSYTPDAAVGAGTDEAGDNLVFLVGFPRSGTTLIEEILATRPRVVTTQEEPLLGALIDRVANDKREQGTYPDVLAALTSTELVEYRQAYLRELYRVTGTDEAETTYIDKLPLNIIDIAFITRLFPAARFLVALRDPRDVCLSCYMQAFRLNYGMVHFLDLADTARFYAATMGLWNHYKQAYDGLRYLEYRYEDLVTEFTDTSKRILDFVGVEWTPDIASFHEKSRAKVVRTPSYIDVATPLFTRAIGRWRHYAAPIASIEPVLEPYIRQFGYEA